MISPKTGIEPWLDSTSEQFKKVVVWSFTFLCYLFVTACRQCLPVAKPFMLGTEEIVGGKTVIVGGFAPFNDPKMGSTYLGILDSSFVLTYTVCSFIWAHKKFAPLLMQFKILNLSLFGSTICLCVFGIGGLYRVSSVGFYIVVQLLLGFVQSGAWSAVLNIYYSTFVIEDGVLLFTVWASMCAVGNVAGRVLSSAANSNFGWESGFFVIGAIVFFLGLFYPVVKIILLSAAEIKSKRTKGEGINRSSDRASSTNSELLKSEQDHSISIVSDAVDELGVELVDVVERQVVQASDQGLVDHGDDTPAPKGGGASNLEATAARASKGAMILLIALYSVGLMFSKWMNSLMSLWLPVYLTEKAGYSDGVAGAFSSAFDVGALIGMGMAFFANFKYKKPGTVCFVMCLISIPILFIYNKTISYLSLVGNFLVLMVIGMLFNGPYSLISTAVTMQLSEQFGQNANMIISIVNGSGSAGSLFAGVFTGMVSASFGWTAVFYMLIGLALLQLVPMGYILMLEWRPAQGYKAVVDKH